MITMQETFDFVVGKIREQGCASMGDNKSCLYRGPNGTKCAAGHVIPDDKYDPIMENCTVAKNEFTGMNEGVKLIRKVLLETGHDLQILRGLQFCHDESSRFENFLERFEREAKSLAETYELQYTPPVA